MSDRTPGARALTRRDLPGVALAALLAAARPARARTVPFDVVAFPRPVPAPSFALPALDAPAVSLGDHLGRHVLLNFWATWCPPCVAEMPSIETLHRRFAPRGPTVLAIASREGPEAARLFVDRLGLTFAVLLDADGAVSARYGARELPVTFLLDPRGRIVAAARGERDWSSPAASAYVEEWLRRPAPRLSRRRRG